MILKDLNQIADKGQIVDIRRPSEWYENGIINGAHLITFEGANGALNPLFLRQIEAIFKKDEPIFLMCHAASRSKRAAQMLADNGFSSVGEVRGGAFYQAKIGAQFSTYEG